MLFNSYIFILLFLPVSILFYYLANKTRISNLGKCVLIIESCVFVAYMNIAYLYLLGLSVLVNYVINMIIYKQQGRVRKILLSLGILFNAGLLGHCKYTNFLIENLNQIFNTDFNMVNILLPLGISFYTFQQISYAVDNYRGEVPLCSFVDYVLYVVYFPKFIQGPIVYHNELIPQFLDESKKKFNFENFSRGFSLFAIGLAKKVLVADNFGKIVDYGYSSISSLNSFEAILVFLGYTFQLYFDFSGYCDMASGVSLMFNIELPYNFNSPYKALNISDFWKRWHITLTRFLTKYIYIPLGGNRKGIVRTYINIIIVFLVSGIWHGVGYTFIIWGLFHGIATVLYRATKKVFDKFPKLLQWMLTFTYVNITWVFFRAANISGAWSLLCQMFSGGFGINAELVETLLQPTLISAMAQIVPINILMIILFVVAIWVVVKARNSIEMHTSFKPRTWEWIRTYILFILSVLSVSGVSSFLYVNF